jgi:hypothetical protein
MPRITKAIIKASLNPERLYSKAEDVAFKMKQLKNIGSDARRHFIKQGVTKEELEELGLTELFEQRRVTQAEILERIDENRIEFEEEIAIGGRESDVDFDIQQMEMEEYFGGPSGVEAEMDYDLEESIKDYYYTEFVDQADDTLNERELNLKKWSQGEIALDDLPTTLINELRENAYENVSTMYYDNPATVVQLYVDNNPVEGYRLVQSPYDDSFTPPNDALPSLRREFGVDSNNTTYGRQDADYSVRSVNEAQVRLSQHALEQDEMQLAGDTRWSEYTVDGGENYREIRYRLAGPEKFREGTHFPDDVNNVFHARVTDRVDTDGNNVLFVEELQSDWAQQGRREGFMDPETLAKGEDQIRGILEVNEIPQTLAKFRDNYRSAEVPQLLENLHEASSPKIPYREKMGLLSKFDRQYQRVMNSGRQDRFIEAIEGRLSDKEKYDIAVFEIEQANQRVGTPGLEGTYRMPDPNLQKGRAEIEVLVDKHLKSQYNRILNGDAPTWPIQRIAYEMDANASTPGEGLRSLLDKAEKAAKESLDTTIESYGLPRNFVDVLEESMDVVRPGLASDLRVEAQKPQAAPFVRDSNAWNKLAVKRLVGLAEEEGYDKVMFSPSEVQIDRWGEEGLRGQYDVNIPKAIKQVTGSKPGQTTFRSDYGGETITGPSIDLNQKTPTGETVAERAKAGQTMYMAPLAAAGLAGLAAPEMAEASDVPINEGIGQLPRSTGEERGVLEEVGDFARYGPEVAYDALNAMILRPVAGSIGGRTAYDLGLDPETVRGAQSRLESLVDYEASPGAQAYGERIMGGIGDLLESDTAQRVAPYVQPALEGLEAVSEGVTGGILGLIERIEEGRGREDEDIDALLETQRPGIEAIQPI